MDTLSIALSEQFTAIVQYVGRIRTYPLLIVNLSLKFIKYIFLGKIA